ncbi:AMP-binding protein [Rhodococcus artemisiae]|uniref:AMP-binding protein n=1 Tax=Rhodococcus artemisiae TaxID=714159 RepID=A0ABU7LC79_9NOCA|nr:AMP-binding protein [Rhodococcus artemisiae]MEE2059125.1 AMP-binding protein [Rhodococcus artemisiae]
MNAASSPAPTAGHRVEGGVSFWEIARSDPTRVAVIDPSGQETSYGDLLVRADAIAAELLELGLVRGDTVAVLMQNTPGFFAVQLATSQIGLYLTPLNFHLGADEVAYILTNSDSLALFVGEDEGLAQIGAGAADSAGIDARLRFTTGSHPGFRSIGALLARHPDPQDRWQGLTMLYTSGTTGRPKGVKKALPHVRPEEALASSFSAQHRTHGLMLGPGVHAVVAPLYHAAPNGFALAALHMGRTVVLFDKWTPEGFLRSVQTYHVTDTHMVPTMFHRLLALPESVRAQYDLSSLRAVVHAAAPCPVHEKYAMIEWLGPILFEYYSATEGGGTAVSAQDWLEHPGTVGRVWPGAALKVLGPDGNELPPREIGTIYLRNATPFEYHKDPAKTAASRQGDFFTTGDVGYLDEDGWLFISDRRSDLIISGGVNIYPAEIEQVLLEHPAVQDAAVIGLPDPEWGAAAHAVVELKEALAPSEELAEKLLEHCRGRLAKYKCPRTIEFRGLPRTETGKLSRLRLRDAIVDERAH